MPYYFSIPLRDDLTRILPFIANDEKIMENLYAELKISWIASIPFAQEDVTFDLDISLPREFGDFTRTLVYKEGFLTGPAIVENVSFQGERLMNFSSYIKALNEKISRILERPNDNRDVKSTQDKLKDPITSYRDYRSNAKPRVRWDYEKFYKEENERDVMHGAENRAKLYKEDRTELAASWFWDFSLTKTVKITNIWSDYSLAMHLIEALRRKIAGR